MSAQIERAVLASILFNPDVVMGAKDRGIASDWFTGVNRTIYTAMVTLAERRVAPDYLNVSDELARVTDNADIQLALSDLLAVQPHPLSAGSYLDEFADQHRRRTVRTRLLQAIEEIGRQPEADVEAIVSAVLADLPRAEGASGPVPFAHLADQMRLRLEAQHAGTWEERVVSTGFPTLDKVLGGGFRPGELIVVAGRPGSGKSSFALPLAKHAARTAPAALFSLEMGGSSIYERAIADAAGMTMGQLRARRLSDDHYHLLRQVNERMAGVPVYVDDTAGLTTEQAHLRASRLKVEQGLSLVVCDYLQIMGDGKQRNENDQYRVSRMSRAMKLLAMDLGVPNVMLSQLNRAVESLSPPIPRMSHLRDSGSIEQDADVVLLLYRHDYYVEQGMALYDAELAGTCDVIVAKQRNGSTGTVRLNFDPSTMSFSDPAVAPPAWVSGVAD